MPSLGALFGTFSQVTFSRLSLSSLGFAGSHRTILRVTDFLISIFD